MTTGQSTGEITTFADLRNNRLWRADLMHAWSEGDNAALESTDPTNPYRMGELHDAWELGLRGVPLGNKVAKHSLERSVPGQRCVAALVADNGHKWWPAGGGQHRAAEVAS